MEAEADGIIGALVAVVAVGGGCGSGCYRASGMHAWTFWQLPVVHSRQVKEAGGQV